MTKKNTAETTEQEPIPETEVTKTTAEEFRISMSSDPLEIRAGFVTWLKINNEPLEDTFDNFKSKYEKFKKREVQ